MKAVISLKMTEEPKIIPTKNGARVEFEIYDVSLDELRNYVGHELELTIKDLDENEKDEFDA